MVIISGTMTSREWIIIDSNGVTKDSSGNVLTDFDDFTVNYTNSDGTARLTIVTPGYYTICSSENTNTVSVTNHSSGDNWLTMTYGTGSSNRAIIFWGDTSPVPIALSLL